MKNRLKIVIPILSMISGPIYAENSPTLEEFAQKTYELGAGRYTLEEARNCINKDAENPTWIGTQQFLHTIMKIQGDPGEGLKEGLFQECDQALELIANEKREKKKKLERLAADLNQIVGSDITITDLKRYGEENLNELDNQLRSYDLGQYESYRPSREITTLQLKLTASRILGTRSDEM